MIYPHYKCFICSSSKEERRLVRDHNHVTGEIRGILCDRCNQYLYIYQYILNHGFFTRKLKSKYIKWASEFESRIKQHLDNSTGLQYVEPISSRFYKS